MVRHFGEKLRYLRRGQKVTQAELAARLGVITQSYVSHLEAGRKEPSIEVAIQIADTFGVTLDYLLRDTIPAELSTNGDFKGSVD
jgi:transcriptional regulator with XRE-family HTH domain